MVALVVRLHLTCHDLTFRATGPQVSMYAIFISFIFILISHGSLDAFHLWFHFYLLSLLIYIFCFHHVLWKRYKIFFFLELVVNFEVLDFDYMNEGCVRHPIFYSLFLKCVCRHSLTRICWGSHALYDEYMSPSGRQMLSPISRDN